MKKTIYLTTVALIVAVGLSGCARIKHGTITKRRDTGLPTVSNEVDVKTDWVAHVSHGSQHKDYLYQPVAHNNAIYTTDYRGNLFAFDRTKAKYIWKDAIKAPIVTSPVYGDDKLFFATEDNKLYAVNSEDGKIAWHISLPSEVIDTPAYGPNLVVVKTTDGQLIAYNSADGEQKWTYKEIIPRLVLRQNSPPKIEYPYVFAGFADGKVVALAADSGRLVWEQTIAQPVGFSELKRMVDITGELQIEGDSLYVSSYHGNVAAIEIRTGQVKWARELSSKSGLAVNYRHVVVTDSKGLIWALNRDNGEVVWRQNDLESHQLTAPTTYEDYIVVADNDGRIYWMDDSDGHFVAREYLSTSGINATPLVYDSKVYVTSSNGNVMALAPQLADVG